MNYDLIPAVAKLKRKWQKLSANVSEVLLNTDNRTDEFWANIWPRMVDAEAEAYDAYHKKRDAEHQDLLRRVSPPCRSHKTSIASAKVEMPEDVQCVSLLEII